MSGQFLTFRDTGVLLLLLLWFTTYKDMPFKNSPWFSKLPWYFSSSPSSIYQQAWVNLPNADHSTLPTPHSSHTTSSAVPLFPSAPPLHTHQADLHLLTDGFKTLWCYMRLCLPTTLVSSGKTNFSGTQGLEWQEPGLQLELCHLLCRLWKIRSHH